VRWVRKMCTEWTPDSVVGAAADGTARPVASPVTVAALTAAANTRLGTSNECGRDERDFFTYRVLREGR
jgi:hypothetical protein